MEDKGTSSGRGLFPERALLEKVHCAVRLNEPPCTSTPTLMLPAMFV